MNSQSSKYIPYSGSSQRKGIFTRSRIFIGLGVLSGLSSFIVIIFTCFLIMSTFTVPVTSSKARSTVKAYATVTAPPTHTATLPATPIPTPTPITPFPPYLQQEVTMLKNHDRFIVQGNPHIAEVALTFDDGPNPTYTPQILTVLRQYEIQATFFCVGNLAQQYPELVRQEVIEGHTIGNHTWSHSDMSHLLGPSLIWQIATAQDAISRVIGTRPIYFRPPYGAISPDALKYINIFGLTTVIWNTDPTDWKRPGVDAIVNTVMRQAGNGAIILLHDGGGDRSQTVAALPIIISNLEEMGYTFVTIPQIFKDLHIQPEKQVTKPSQLPASPTPQHM